MASYGQRYDAVKFRPIGFEKNNAPKKRIIFFNPLSVGRKIFTKKLDSIATPPERLLSFFVFLLK
ncbi:hypothetical protein EAX61_06880 [Dokdonia sinensis]|uniref:Uncharacterized protein n=1 Tax=Dokdonia sinensis TaxID=2479847 RepID=A0A3M0G667_9FLAO|nr:hypothetical protein EAX61_06880 [Dokdonia sinensis]